MQRPRRLSNQSGFTIIEVLIVLAIAGIMLLIVFEAIPALERSGRNNQRKQDVQAILASVSHYELNNSGDVPTCGAGSGGASSCVGTGTNQLGNPDLTYYDPANIIIKPSPLYAAGTYSVQTTSNIETVEQILVENHLKCETNGNATNDGASYSDIVALYAIENGSAGSTPQCQQL